MILSVSRRTDIPAFYSEWFYNRIKDGYVYVRNPMNIHQVSRIPINSDIVDCIVFWTKNPKAMMSRLDELSGFQYYFQFTINPYDNLLELNVPRKNSIIETFKELSDKIGKNRVIWRYDPILMSQNIDSEYHKKYFEELSKRLSPYTERCVISFVDNYSKTERNLNGTTARELDKIEILNIVENIAEIAQAYGTEIQTCAEECDLSSFGIKQGKCIDDNIIEDILGYKIPSKKDKNQRKECGCIESIDIGEYNTCPHNCLYCYANFNRKEVIRKKGIHNPESPLLVGDITDKDIIKDRKVKSFKPQGFF